MKRGKEKLGIAAQLEGLFAPSKVSYAIAYASASLMPRDSISYSKMPHISVPRFLRIKGIGLFLYGATILGVGSYGFWQGNHYQAFIQNFGRFQDVFARFLGFDVKEIKITGEKELSEAEILHHADMPPHVSLAFLDVEQVRRALMRLPLIEDASVHKLYPNQLAINISERVPFALWQTNGNVRVVSPDGTVVAGLRDGPFMNLPFVVGEGANARVEEYVRLLSLMGDLRTKVRAGIWVGDRRWTLKFTSGLELKLPEENPDKALREFVRLELENHLLKKNVLGFDMRQADRLVIRLPELPPETQSQATTDTKIKRVVR